MTPRHVKILRRIALFHVFRQIHSAIASENVISSTFVEISEENPLQTRCSHKIFAWNCVIITRRLQLH